MRRDRVPLGSQARGSQTSAASIPTCVSRGIVVIGNKASRRWVRAMCEAHMAVPELLRERGSLGPAWLAAGFRPPLLSAYPFHRRR